MKRQKKLKRTTEMGRKFFFTEILWKNLNLLHRNIVKKSQYSIEFEYIISTKLVK